MKVNRCGIFYKEYNLPLVLISDGNFHFAYLSHFVTAHRQHVHDGSAVCR